MFTLSDQTCTLAHFNVRTEKHGEKKRPAADLKITLTGPNTLLDLFEPELRAALFKAPPAVDAAQLFESEAPLTELRFPKLAPIKLSHELKGRDVSISYGIDEVSDILIACCDIDGFVAELVEGGSVSITFRIAGHPTERDAGKLYGLQQQEITLTIHEPAQGSLIGGEDEDDDEREAA